MNDFTFSNTTKVYFGVDQLPQLGTELGKAGKTVLLVYGGGSIKRSGLYGRIQGQLQAAGLKTVELAGVEPNPRHTTVNRGAALCRAEGVDAVLAVGGGSVIDCGKAVAATVFCPTGNVWDMVEGREPLAAALPVFAMPTAASTGSEMDKSCVISNTDRDEKRGLSNELLRPRAAFLDPTNTFSVGAYQTACGGFDIMSHFLDLNYFTRAEKYDLQRGIIESILRTVKADIPAVLAEPTNYKARADLLWAASWALNSFCTSGQAQAASCHAMEHELSACYDMTHGLGLAILTPRWMRYLLERDATVAPDFARFGTEVMGLPAADAADVQKTAEAAIHALESYLYTTLGLKSTLTAAGIDDKRFAEMAAKACGGKTLHGYRDLNAQDIEAIYRLCL